MPLRRPLSADELDQLLAATIANQAAEGMRLSADEIVEVRRRLGDEHRAGATWSRSWDGLCAIARILHRPELLRGGREMELFATGVVIEAGIEPGPAWARIEAAFAEGRRGLVLAVAELIAHGPPEAERTDPIRFCHLTKGIAVARAAGWPASIAALLSAT